MSPKEERERGMSRRGGRVSRAILGYTFMNYGDFGSTLVYDGSIIIRHVCVDVYISRNCGSFYYSANSLRRLTRHLTEYEKLCKSNMNFSVFSERFLVHVLSITNNVIYFIYL